MDYRTLTTVLVGAALLVGCDEQTAPTETSEALRGPSANFTNGPESPGIVFRFGRHISIVDWNEDFFVIQNMGVLDPAESPFCTGNFDDFDRFDFQLSMAVLIQSEGTQHVYDFDGVGADLAACVEDPDCENFCELVQGPRVAEGFGNIQINDNGISGTLKAQGTLHDLVNGGCARFTWVDKFVAPPGGTPHGFVDISLHHIASTSCLD